MALYTEVLNAFGLRYLVLHDVDPVSASPGDKEYGEQKKAFDENERIEQAMDAAYGTRLAFDPDLERVAGISASSGEKRGKPLAALEHFTDGSKQIPSVIDQAVRLAYGV